MTKTELEWVRNAVDILDKGAVSEMHEAKILRTIAQIFDMAAAKAEVKFIDRVDTTIEHNAFIERLSK